MEQSLTDRRKMFVRTYILENILASGEEIDEIILNEKYWNHWERCFTSSLSSDVNYEPIENIGDLLHKTILSTRLLEAHPSITPGELNNTKDYYITNDMHVTVSDKLFPDNALNNIIQWDVLEVYKTGDVNIARIPDGVIADVYEAILQTIYNIFELKTQSLGYHMAYNWFVYTEKKSGINMTEIKTEPRTEWVQLYDIAGISPPTLKTGIIEIEKDLKISFANWNNVKVPSQNNYEEITFTVPPSHLKKIQDIYSNATLKKNTIYATTEKDVKKLAAQMLLEFLAGKGFTIKIAREMKTKRWAKSNKELYLKLVEHGYNSVSESVDTKLSSNGNVGFYSIHGIDINGRKHLLLSIAAPGDRQKAYDKLSELWMQGYGNQDIVSDKKDNTAIVNALSGLGTGSSARRTRLRK